MLVLAGLAALSLGALSGCESTQSRSAELEERGAKTLLADSGLEIDKQSTEVTVGGSELLSDANGSAVVVTLRNRSQQDLTDVPILIDVLDTKGKSVYRNDIPGIEPALAAVPFIPAGSAVEWVNDQVLASGKPKRVLIKVGADASSYNGEIPQVEVSDPRLDGDPVSGIEATGDVVNRSGEDQGRLLLYVVARKGGEVVAAGRGAIEHLKAGTKPVHYDVFFIGNPSGAELELSAFPTLPGQGPE